MEEKKSFRIYKANKTGTGSALGMDMNVEKEAIFLEVANQMGEKRFDWNNKITMKLSISDIGNFLAVLRGKKDSIRLFHEPAKGEYELAKEVMNTIAELSKGAHGYALRVSQQARSRELRAIQINISDDEGEVLRVLLERAIERIHKW